KSSVLEALALLSHLARRGTLQEDLRPWLRGWPEGVFTRTSAGKSADEATIELHWQRSQYRLVLEDPTSPRIREETLKVGDQEYITTREAKKGVIRTFRGEGAGRPLETDDPYESALGLISRSPLRRKGARAVIDLITRIEVFALDADFLRGTAVDTRPIPYARKGTSLVAGLIDAYKRPSAWDSVLKALRAIQPDLDTITVSEKPPRGVALKYRDGREASLDEESDGFARAAGMFLVRYSEQCPAILGFDEPENGYHLSRLVDVVTRLAPDGGRGSRPPELVLLATHSPALVQKAVRALRERVGVVSLWRGGEGRVMLSHWTGEELLDDDRFDEMVAQAFEGR
ncbi:MAG: ATP-binding protein, partial [Planctomycetes bacterium]|nr:ATP-binding protein [Planctomycetota bacterium]